MGLIERFTRDLSSRRAQHLVYLLHVWACVPFLLAWVTDRHVAALVGSTTLLRLQILVAVTLLYLAGRTWLAYIDPPRLKWWFVFPPVDVAFITAILCITGFGPMSNITLLYFLPIVQASGALRVRWSATVGLLVVVGTALATLASSQAYPNLPATPPKSLWALVHDDPLNVAFRVFFLLVISSLMAYQTLIAAGFREKLGVAADRNRIAMEMHDGVQGHLITIASQLELIARVAETDGAHAAALAVEGREGARQAADELRFLVQRLRTPTLSSGFISALKQYAHNICDRNGLRLVFELNGSESAMSADVESALFRIAQEALTNVVKHAKATSVTISVDVEDSVGRLRLVDDGVGFLTESSCEGIGLEGMRARAAQNDGDLSIESQPGGGTCVTATFRMKGRRG